MIQYNYAESIIGKLLLLADGNDLIGLYMDTGKFDCQPSWQQNSELPVLRQTELQLSEYFRGERQQFDLPIRLIGTKFQIQVWEQLLKISYGTVISYGQLAASIDKPNASRAVGLANGKNPISIIVPCHRVIGANGTLTGYGGGLPRKQTLLALEGANHVQQIRLPLSDCAAPGQLLLRAHQ